MKVEVDLKSDGQTKTVHASGNGPIDAFVHALNADIELIDYHEHAIGKGADAAAACYVELRVGGSPVGFGVGVDRDIVTASFKAVLSAYNRLTPAANAQKKAA